LAADVASDMDMPPHNLSAMDGFACRQADLNDGLAEIETIPAGYMPTKSIGPGECSRIMTGAVVPDGADIVVMVEHTEARDGLVYVVKKSGRTNIRRKAEDIHTGDVVLTAGTVLRPVEIAVLASVGCDPAPVYAMPRVGVVATGDELIEPRQKPSAAKIRNSNSYQLCAQIQRAGCIPKYFGIAKDTPGAVNDILATAMEQCDVVLFSGGVSMGDYDFVPQILSDNGIDIKFEKVKIKPGKPTVFGTKGNKYFFGLPGNPVSTFVLFEVMVRPFLMKLMGHDYTPAKINGKLAKEIGIRKIERAEFRPVKLEPNGSVNFFEYHGSAHIHAYTLANGVVRIPAGVTKINAGANVQVTLI
ncbi:MAG: molybdopterin molybdotransferase MoeA, partial [Planctomycetes bacterium]|nr:molybdopterin molybdotransferase MoeA [Planctomycetota bacterium]